MKFNISYRKLTLDDLPYRMKWLNDPEVFRYLGHQVRMGTDLSFHKQWFDEYLKDDSREIFMILADEQPIGQVGLLDINKLDNNACLYVAIGETEYRGKGIGQRAVKYILEYGFKKLGFHKIWLDVHARNEKAISCYKKCGFVVEGIFKDQVLYEDGYDDEIRMAINEK